MAGANVAELVGSPAGLLVQGITGRQGELETAWMIESGVRISAGVTPGREGEVVHGVPVYDTVEAAVGRHGNVASMVYAPPAGAADAAIEAIEAGVQLVVVSAEGIPTHRWAMARQCARAHGALLVGPNSQGIVIPGVGRIGCPGGSDPMERFAVGDVGIVSRSGGMASELGWLLRRWGFGTSVQVHIGGSPTVALRLLDAALLVAADERTQRIVVFGEPSGDLEDELADAVADGAFDVPVIAMVAGRFGDQFPAALPFGHAPRANASGVASVAQKVARLERAGVHVAHDLSAIEAALKVSTTTPKQGDDG